MNVPATAPTTPTTTTTASSSFLHLDDLFSNPLFAGGIGLAGLGAGLALARKSAVQGAQLIKRRLLVDLEISKDDESYKWFFQWMASHRDPPPNDLMGRLGQKLTRLHHLSIETKTEKNPNGSTTAKFLLQPGYGRHIIRYKNAFIAVNREKQRTQDLTTGKPFETVTLTTLYAHRHIFEDLFLDMHERAKQEVEGKTIMYITRGHEWQQFGKPTRKRPLESVILDKGIKERIVADVKDFENTHNWYIERGIPHRRGYLLYGPPGSGKTSFIKSLAGELDYGVALINLSERGLTDDKLIHLMGVMPQRTILLLEDADAAFVRRRATDADGYQGQNVTFSGLLNALDGVASGEERIAFLTTNHIELLDPALIRPGRVDMTVRIGETTRYQAAEMWDRYYGDIDTDHSGRERFLGRLQDLGFITNEDGEFTKEPIRTSQAALQGLFLYNKGDIEGAIEMVEGLIPKVYEPEPTDGVSSSG